jgi:hypothetical protein
MRKISMHDVLTVALALCLAAPPIWWAGEAFSAARESIVARTE